VRLRDPATGQRVGEPLTGHAGPVYSITTPTVPDGRTPLATGSRDGTVRLWDPVPGEPAGVLHVSQPVNALTGLPGGLLALGHGNETAGVAVHR
jgi:WD40 repeat protein